MTLCTEGNFSNVDSPMSSALKTTATYMYQEITSSHYIHITENTTINKALPEMEFRALIDK
jgi:hypothetical protein